MPDVMKTLGHSQIDILKMDIENGEFSVIPQIFGAANKSGVQAKACQLLIEIHPRPTSAWINLFKTIEKAGFLMFSREANSYCKPPCYEYAFLHESCLDFYAVKKTKIQQNFHLT